MGKRGDIQNSWNAKIDRTNTVLRMGRNGVLYEYLIPTSASPYEY